VNTRTHNKDSLLIVYDADHIQHPGSHLFDADDWEQQGALVGEAEGRGKVLFLETAFGAAVLRQYLRGGWAAMVSRDRYLFSGFETSRPVLEYKVLEQLAAAGLPVPEPLAAMCVRDGRFYSGWLMTRRIMGVTPLADLIESHRGDQELWQKTGACIRRFHDFGLVHADLNARNILVDEGGRVFLIDFDRARLIKGQSRAFQRNLQRLHRSLRKFWPKPHMRQLESCWMQLLAGYDNGNTSP
jgi:3-deoxy-D-manno-octulosonic acid kinase